MNLDSLAPLLDILGAMLTVAGVLITALGAIWAFFRKTIKAWWKPYRSAVEAMSDIPGIKHAVDQSRAEIKAVRDGLTLMAMTVRARTDNNVDAAEYESDIHGGLTYANVTYARWLNVGKAELLGWGWINFVHPEDQVRIRAEWDRCRTEHRTYRQRHRMVSSDGRVLNVETLCTPIPDAPPAHSWIGIIRQLES